MALEAVGSARTSIFTSPLRSINLRPRTHGPSPSSGNNSPQQSGPTDTGSGTSTVPGNRTTGGSSSPGFADSSGPGQSSVFPEGNSGSMRPGETISGKSSSAETVGSGTNSNGTAELTSAKRREVQELKRIDAKVRAHEQAHLAAAGQYAQGGISYETVKGPDGERYAVAGEVSLDTSKADSPRRTIQKMRQVKSAALAPANPSPQDRSIASQAARKLNQARQEQAQDSSGNNSRRSERVSAEDSTASEPSGGLERHQDFGSTPGQANRSDRGDGSTSKAATEGSRTEVTDSRRSRGVEQFQKNASGRRSSPSPGQVLNVLV